MWLNKKNQLKTSYYRSFSALIVIPILVIILTSIGIIKSMMKDSAIQNIRRAQDNIITTLNSEVKDVSLRLSHFVYVNDNEIMKTASKTNTEDAAERYHYTMVLSESFNYAMVPVRDILSAIFFMKDGDFTYMKENIMMSREEVEETNWYQEALADKNIVKIGFYDTNVTYSRQNAHSFTIVAALSPGIDVDRDSNIEMTALFVTSQVGSLIKNYNKESLLGSTMILDKDGTVLFDANGSAKLLPEGENYEAGRTFSCKVNQKKYTYVVSEEPMTQCKIISIIESHTLTKQFNQIAVIMIAIMVLLFLLFYCFSSYFLKNILEPVHNLVTGMETVEEGNLEVHLEPLGQAEIRTMVHSFNSMVRRLRHLMEENEEQQEKKHEAEIRALQSQINPHFLVNSLNSIRFMAQVSKFDGIRKMAEALIKILSTSFRSNSGFHTVGEELEVLDGFIYLMKIRYSDGFDVHYHVEEACKGYKVPRLILQPIVENSIVHGFSQLVDDIGMIEVGVKREEDVLVFTIKDNGKGMAEEEIAALLEGCGKEGTDHTSVGVTNVATRLKLNYGENCEMMIESQMGSYTMTTMRIPAKGEGRKREMGYEESTDCR